MTHEKVDRINSSAHKQATKRDAGEEESVEHGQSMEAES